jgi:hypothetical protein
MMSFKQNMFLSFLLFGCVTFLNLNAQNTKSQEIRIRDNFDFNWQFHKGDIAVKYFIVIKPFRLKSKL